MHKLTQNSCKFKHSKLIDLQCKKECPHKLGIHTFNQASTHIIFMHTHSLIFRHKCTKLGAHTHKNQCAITLIHDKFAFNSCPRLNQHYTYTKNQALTHLIKGIYTLKIKHTHTQFECIHTKNQWQTPFQITMAQHNVIPFANFYACIYSIYKILAL